MTSMGQMGYDRLWSRFTWILDSYHLLTRFTMVVVGCCWVIEGMMTQAGPVGRFFLLLKLIIHVDRVGGPCRMTSPEIDENWNG